MENPDNAPLSNLTADGKFWSKTWSGYPLIIGNVYSVANEFWVYAGDFVHKKDVPNVPCCYTMGDEFRIRRITPNTFAPKPKDKRKRNDDDRPIDTEIKDNDNTLMILIKTALKHNDVTRGDFKLLYQNVSDMNNSLRCIENGENLSWARFVDLCRRLGVTYDLSIYANDQTKILQIGQF